MEKTINKLIENLLEKCDISQPPIDVESVAKLLDISVVKRPYKDKGNLAAMLVRNKQKVIIGINENHNTLKQRFSIAHEIGHYFLHEGEELIVDKDYVVNYRDYKSDNVKRSQERDANYFASCLLIPEKFLVDDLKMYEIDMLGQKQFEDIAKELHKKYAVSLITMRLRLYSFLHSVV